jgi:hypothetical protein
MDNKYLWDRSGEPDPEIQELEELLGTLRYQPEPLKIPADFQIARRRNLYPPLAIAAALLLFAVAIGFWINFKRQPDKVATQSGDRSEQNTTPSSAIAKPPAPEERTADDKALVVPPRRRTVTRPTQLASNQAGRRKTQPPALTPEQVALKEQVLLAFRLTSAKLNVAQRNIQGPPPANTIRNQHKIG